MPTLTLYIAEAGTPTIATKSAAGHMWLSAQSGSETISRGFAPSGDKSTPFGAGKVFDTDNTYYKAAENTGLYKRTIEISVGQFNKFKAINTESVTTLIPGLSLYYNALSNSCIDVAYSFLSFMGINPGNYQGSLLPSGNKSDIPTLFAFYSLMAVDARFGTLSVQDWAYSETNGMVVLERVVDQFGTPMWNLRPNFSAPSAEAILRPFMKQTAEDRAEDMAAYWRRTSIGSTQPRRGTSPILATDDGAELAGNSIVPGTNVALKDAYREAAQSAVHDRSILTFGQPGGTYVEGVFSTFNGDLVVSNLVSAMAQFSAGASAGCVTAGSYRTPMQIGCELAVGA